MGGVIAPSAVTDLIGGDRGKLEMAQPQLKLVMVKVMRVQKEGVFIGMITVEVEVTR